MIVGTDLFFVIGCSIVIGATIGAHVLRSFPFLRWRLARARWRDRER